jgi:hypothetical protein
MVMALMMQYIKENLNYSTKGNPDYKAEAYFYCSDNNYDYKQARKAFDADVQFEREQLKSKKKKWFGLF